MKLPFSLLSILVPTPCVVCDETLDTLAFHPSCEKCWNSTYFYDRQTHVCHKCGKPSGRPSRGVKSYCHECDDDFYDLARACGSYDDSLRAAVLFLKTTPRVSGAISEKLFDTYVSSDLSTADLVIPMPLSKRRQFERGFNQALILAEGFAEIARIPVDPLSLERKKHTKKSRASMDVKGRRDTVANAFRVRRKTKIEEKKILLIDDVMTTGATCSMAAKALKKAGAKRVEVLTAARASKQQ